MVFLPSASPLSGAKTTQHNLDRIVVESVRQGRYAYAKNAAPPLAGHTMKYLYPVFFVTQALVTADVNFTDLLGKWVPWTASTTTANAYAIDGFLFNDPDKDGWARSADQVNKYDVVGLTMLKGVIHIDDIAHFNPFLESTLSARAGTPTLLQCFITDIANGFLARGLTVEGIDSRQ